MQNIFSRYDGIKLVIGNEKKFETFVNMWKLNNTLLTKQQVNK